jgi:outer membrane protein assembly factor BamB
MAKLWKIIVLAIAILAPSAVAIAWLTRDFFTPTLTLTTVWSRSDLTGLSVSADGRILVIGTGKELIRLDPESGRPLWSVACAGTPRGLVMEGTTVITGSRGELRAYRVADGSEAWRAMAATDGREVEAFDGLVAAKTDDGVVGVSAVDGGTRWIHPAKSPRGILGGRPFLGVFLDGATFAALDPSSGQELWRRPDVGAVSEVYAGLLMTRSMDGKSHVLSATTGQEQPAFAHWQKGWLVGGTPDRLWMMDVTDGRLHCISTHDGKEFWVTRPPRFRGGRWATFPLPPVQTDWIEEQDSRLFAVAWVQTAPTMRDVHYRLDAYTSGGLLIWVAPLPTPTEWIRPPYVLCRRGQYLELLKIPDDAK